MNGTVPNIRPERPIEAVFQVNQLAFGGPDLGHPSYYPRFGFIPGEPLGIRPPFEVSAGAFMVLKLRPGALAGDHGEVRYPPESAQV